MLAHLRSLVRAVTRRSTLERDMAEELRFHVDARTADLASAGISPDEARRRASIEFGAVESYKDACREARGLRWLDELRGDLRYGARTLRRSAAFTIVAVASLALGIGGNSAIFHLLDVVRLRALPIPHPQELAEVRVSGSHGGMGVNRGFNGEMTYPLWEQVRDHQSAFSAVFAWGDGLAKIGDEGSARRVRNLSVSGDFFSALGVPALRGRLLSREDDQRGCGRPGIVISEPFWQREYGGQDAAIGQTLTVFDRRLDIIGVTPAAFTGLEVGRGFDIVLPICAQELWGASLDARNTWWLRVMGRLRRGWTVAAASGALGAISPGLLDATVPPGYTTQTEAKYRALRLEVSSAARGVSALREDYDSWLWLLLAMTGSVLLIVCANLANLMVARASAREREFAIRLALGASRGRLVRQVLCESGLLVAAAAALSVGVARVASGGLVWLLSTAGNPVELDLGMDWRVFAFTAIVASLTCLAFGLTAAWRSSLADPGATIKSGGRGMTAGRDRFTLQRALVVAQMAVSVLLLVAAMLFVRSFRNLATLDTGFEQKGLAIVQLDFSRLHVPVERREAFKQNVLERLESLPQVRAAATTTNVPLHGSSWTMGVHVLERPGDQGGPSKFTWISPGYFRTMQIPLIAGRAFSERDAISSVGVAVVNQTFVRQFLGDGDPLSAAIRTTAEPGYPAATYQIVGVVKDTKYSDLREPVRPIAFLPSAQHPSPPESAAIVVRSADPDHPPILAVQQQIRELSPDAFVEIHLMDAFVRDSLAGDRAMATLAGFFGQLSTVVAMIGLYGLISYIVVRRRNEIGVRIALGASRAGVVGLVLKETLTLVAAGIAIGVPAVFVAARLVHADLFAVDTTDPAIVVAAVVILTAVAAPAGFVPAYRASRTDPMEALRWE